MQGVATVHPAADFVSQFLAGIIEWFAPKADRAEDDEVTVRVRRFTDPIALASNEAELDAAFSTAAQRLPEFISEIARFVPIQLLQSSAAIENLPWLVERVVGDLDAGADPREFLALLLLHLRVFERIMQKAPPQELKRAAEMRREDVLRAQRDPGAMPLFEAVTALFAFTRIHEILGRADTWRRVRILARVVTGLHVSAARLPAEYTFAWMRWYVESLRELGLWLRELDLTPLIEKALHGSPPNRSALESLRARFAQGHALVYVGDVRGTIERDFAGGEIDQKLDRRLVEGERYERGEASIQELARVWGANVPDVLADLERMNITRSPDVLRLSDEGRRARLAKLRADRLVRDGEPARDPDAVNRSVIASQRIEGIDARGHLREMPGRERS